MRLRQAKNNSLYSDKKDARADLARRIRHQRLYTPTNQAKLDAKKVTGVQNTPGASNGLHGTATPINCATPLHPQVTVV
jgi:hypothetical protein